MKTAKVFLVIMLVHAGIIAQGLSISSNAAFNLGSAVLSLAVDWSNNGTLNSSNGTLAFTNNSGNQTYTDKNDTPMNNFLVNKFALR